MRYSCPTSKWRRSSGGSPTRTGSSSPWLSSTNEYAVSAYESDHRRRRVERSRKKMLDRSGIKKRAVVVSSCHSGSFIPALADPNTLVITASRADRNSFGCEDRRQWTYFGDAYFNQALRQDASFRRAFDRARELIAAWEAEERQTP